MLATKPIQEGAPGLKIQGFTVSVPVSDMQAQAPVSGQLEKEKIKLKKLMYKVIIVSVFGLVCILIAFWFTYFNFSSYKSHSSATQMFRIVIHDKSATSDFIPLDITVDPERQLEYSRSPQEGAEGLSGEILGLKDFKKGIFAYKEEHGKQCFIGKIMPDSSLHTFGNGTIQEADVDENEMFVYLNYTIHPFILRLAAGDNVVNFCGDRDAVWMIPAEEDVARKDEKRSVRVRRWKCKGWGCEGISHKRCFWTCKWVDERQKCTRRCVPK